MLRKRSKTADSISNFLGENKILGIWRKRFRNCSTVNNLSRSRTYQSSIVKANPLISGKLVGKRPPAQLSWAAFTYLCGKRSCVGIAESVLIFVDYLIYAPFSYPWKVMKRRKRKKFRVRQKMYAHFRKRTRVNILRLNLFAHPFKKNCDMFYSSTRWIFMVGPKQLNAACKISLC